MLWASNVLPKCTHIKNAKEDGRNVSDKITTEVVWDCF